MIESIMYFISNKKDYLIDELDFEISTHNPEITILIPNAFLAFEPTTFWTQSHQLSQFVASVKLNLRH